MLTYKNGSVQWKTALLFLYLSVRECIWSGACLVNLGGSSTLLGLSRKTVSLVHLPALYFRPNSSDPTVAALFTVRNRGDGGKVVPCLRRLS